MTKSAFLRDLRTVVNSTAFLGQTTRPFAKWELVKNLRAEADVDDGVRKDGQEEVLAETLDAEGNVVGMWVVLWKKAVDDAKMVEGEASGQGRIVRHFNVHEELLTTPPDAKES